jgi:NO-binding membrane sensor protein with MHYT domain
MAEIHHFAYGWSNPTLAFVLSTIGWALGLILAARARQSRAADRARWLVLAAVAFGGGGIWLMRSMAMLGFDVPEAVPTYDLPTMIASLVLAMVVVGIGLFAVGLPGCGVSRLLGAGVFAGAGLGATHYVAVGAIRLSGKIEYNPVPVGISVGCAVIVACAALWASVSVPVGSSTLWAAMLLAAGSCLTHYVGMSAVRVRLVPVDHPAGVNPFSMLTPISVLACVAIGALAYATIGYAMRQETDPAGPESASAVPELSDAPAPRVGERVSL